ncbi:MAG: hypothetical protein ACTH31_11450 [Pseudoclavibacter sp.]
MAVGWYLETDGATHRLREGAGWTDLVVAPDTDPGRWPGIPLGAVATGRAATALTRALRAVATSDGAGEAQASIALRIGDGWLTVSAQGAALASFSVPLHGAAEGGAAEAGADAPGNAAPGTAAPGTAVTGAAEPSAAPPAFSALVAADDARRLAEFAYPTMRLAARATDDWQLAIGVTAESGASIDPVVTSRENAPATHAMLSSVTMVAGALVHARAFRERLEAVAEAAAQATPASGPGAGPDAGAPVGAAVALTFAPHGLAVTPESHGAAGGSATAGRLAAAPLAAAMAGEPFRAVVSARNLLVCVANLERDEARIDLRVNLVGGEARVTLATYDADDAPGWYMLQQLEGDES